MATEKTEQKPKKAYPEPKAIAGIDEFFEDRAKKYSPTNLELTISWANDQLVKLEEAGYPIITSILNFEPKFAEFMVREVLHNPSLDWSSRRYKLFVRNDKLLPTNEPTGAPLPAELHQEVIALKLGLKSSFNRVSNRSPDDQVVENPSYSASNMQGAFTSARRKYKWDGNPVLIQEISKSGTEVPLIKAITLLSKYGCDVTKDECNQWLFEV